MTETKEVFRQNTILSYVKRTQEPTERAPVAKAGQLKQQN